MQVKLEIVAYGRDEVKSVAETLGYLADHMPERDPYAGALNSAERGMLASTEADVAVREAGDYTQRSAAPEPAAEPTKRKRRTAAEKAADAQAIATAAGETEEPAEEAVEQVHTPEAEPAISATPEDRQDPAADEDIFGSDDAAETDETASGEPTWATIERSPEEASAFFESDVRPVVVRLMNSIGKDRVKAAIGQTGFATIKEVPPGKLDELLAYLLHAEKQGA